MILPSICIVTAAARNDANLVWAAMGRGPNTFSRALCAADPEATWETPATHYCMHDAHSDEADVHAWQAMAEGVLPEIDGEWGVSGVISEEDAIAAVSAENLQVYSASGEVTPLEHLEGILAGRGLQTVPFPD